MKEFKTINENRLLLAALSGLFQAYTDHLKNSRAALEDGFPEIAEYNKEIAEEEFKQMKEVKEYLFGTNK
jgi:rubrerythrin